MADILLTIAGNTAELDKAINQVLSKPRSVKGITANTFTEPLGRITGKSSEFQKSLEASNARVLAFGASAGAIFAVQKAFSVLVTSTIEVEKSINGIGTILGVSSGTLKTFSNDLFAVASQTGTSFKNATEAAQEFARQGLSVSETLLRTRDALILARISGMDFADSARSITTAINAFGKEMLTSTEIINRLSAADTSFAVSAKDLADALSRVGSAAEDSNVSFNQTIALVTSAAQITGRSGSVIGNAFKSMFTRLERPKVLADLESIGVATRNAGGGILPMMSILKNLAASYDTLAPGQKSFISETVGGIYQINTLKAVLSDLGSGFSVYDAALKTVNNSTGSAINRNEQLNQTISSKLTATLNNLTQVAAKVGSITLAPMMKGGADFGSGFLKDASERLDSEGVGGQFARGVLKGIGGAIGGPGLQFITFAILKLFQNLTVFAAKAVGDFSGLNTKSKQLALTQVQVLEKLSQQPAILDAIKNKTLTVDQAAKSVFAEIKAENSALNAQLSIMTLISQVGMKAGLSVQGVKYRTKVASGYVPNFNSDFAAEEVEARSLGAVNPRAHLGKGTIGGKPFVMNSKETEIPNFGSNGDSAVIPNYSKGFVPNFGSRTVKSLRKDSLIPLYNMGERRKVGEAGEEGRIFDHFNILIKPERLPRPYETYRKIATRFYNKSKTIFEETKATEIAKANKNGMAGEGTEDKVSEIALEKANEYIRSVTTSDGKHYGGTFAVESFTKKFDSKIVNPLSGALGEMDYANHNREKGFSKLKNWQGPDFLDRSGQYHEVKVKQGETPRDELIEKVLRAKALAQPNKTYKNQQRDDIDCTFTYARAIEGRDKGKVSAGHYNRATTGNVPNFADLSFQKSYDKEFGITRMTGVLGKKVVGDIEYSGKGTREIEAFDINSEFRGKGYAKQFYKAMGKGKTKGTLLPNFDKDGNVFFPQLSRARSAKDAGIMHYDAMEKTKKLTVAQFEQLISQNGKNKKYWDENSFDLFTSHASGHIPNFSPAYLRGMTPEGAGLASVKSKDTMANAVRMIARFNGVDEKVLEKTTPEVIRHLIKNNPEVYRKLVGMKAIRYNQGMAKGFFPNFADNRSKVDKLHALIAPNSGAMPGERAAAEAALSRIAPKKTVFSGTNPQELIAELTKHSGRSLNQDTIDYINHEFKKGTFPKFVGHLNNAPGFLNGVLGFAKGHVPNFSEDFSKIITEKVMSTDSIVWTDSLKRKQAGLKNFPGFDALALVRTPPKGDRRIMPFSIKTGKNALKESVYNETIPLGIEKIFTQKDVMSQISRMLGVDARTTPFGASGMISDERARSWTSEKFNEIKGNRMGFTGPQEEISYARTMILHDMIDHKLSHEVGYEKAYEMMAIKALGTPGTIADLEEEQDRRKRNAYTPKMARGFVPNFSALNEAINREMSAGYSSSQIRIGRDGSLKTSSNPEGLGVYNSTEGSLGNGIGLAKSAGINPKTKGKAEGYVPNFSDPMTSMTLGFTQFLMQLPMITAGFDKLITVTKPSEAAVKKFADEIQKLKSDITTTSQEIGNADQVIKRYGTAIMIRQKKRDDTEIEIQAANYARLQAPKDKRARLISHAEMLRIQRAAKDEIAKLKIRANQEDHETAQTMMRQGDWKRHKEGLELGQVSTQRSIAQQERGLFKENRMSLGEKFLSSKGYGEGTLGKGLGKFQGMGMGVSIAASAVGGMASEISSKYQDKDAGKAWGELGDSVSMAGQVMSTIPGPIGMVAAGSIALWGAMKAYEKGTQGFAEQMKAAADFKLEGIDKVNGASNALSQSINNYQNIISNSSSSVEEIAKAGKKYKETLTTFATSGVSSETMSKFTRASTSKERQAVLTEAGEERNREAEGITLKKNSIDLAEKRKLTRDNAERRVAYGAAIGTGAGAILGGIGGAWATGGLGTSAGMLAGAGAGGAIGAWAGHKLGGEDGTSIFDEKNAKEGGGLGLLKGLTKGALESRDANGKENSGEYVKAMAAELRLTTEETSALYRNISLTKKYIEAEESLGKVVVDKLRLKREESNATERYAQSLKMIQAALKTFRGDMFAKDMSAIGERIGSSGKAKSMDSEIWTAKAMSLTEGGALNSGGIIQTADDKAIRESASSMAKIRNEGNKSFSEVQSAFVKGITDELKGTLAGTEGTDLSKEGKGTTQGYNRAAEYMDFAAQNASKSKQFQGGGQEAVDILRNQLYKSAGVASGRGEKEVAQRLNTAAANLSSSKVQELILQRSQSLQEKSVEQLQKIGLTLIEQKDNVQKMVNQRVLASGGGTAAFAQDFGMGYRRDLRRNISEMQSGIPEVSGRGALEYAKKAKNDLNAFGRGSPQYEAARQQAIKGVEAMLTKTNEIHQRMGRGSSKAEIREKATSQVEEAMGAQSTEELLKEQSRLETDGNKILEEIRDRTGIQTDLKSLTSGTGIQQFQSKANVAMDNQMSNSMIRAAYDLKFVSDSLAVATKNLNDIKIDITNQIEVINSAEPVGKKLTQRRQVLSDFQKKITNAPGDSKGGQSK